MNTDDIELVRGTTVDVDFRLCSFFVLCDGWWLRRRVAARLFVTLLALMVAAPALADNWKDCASKNTDRSVKGCTALIKASRETKTNRAIAHYNRGIAYAKNGRLEQAILDLDQSIVLRPKYARAHYSRGLAHYDSGNFDRTTRLNPKFANAYGNRGVVHAAMSDFENAIKDYDRAIALDPKNGFSYYSRGNAFYTMNQYEKALADFRKALKLIPSSDKWNSEAQKHIAEIKEKMASPN